MLSKVSIDGVSANPVYAFRAKEIECGAFTATGVACEADDFHAMFCIEN